MRRNLEHLRDLDNNSSKLMEDWRDKQDGCLHGVETTLLAVFRGEAAAAVGGGSTGDGSAPASPARPDNSKKGTKRKQQQLEKSPEKKVACVKCRAKKVRCNGRQSYCLNRFKTPSSESTNESMESGDNKQSPEGSSLQLLDQSAALQIISPKQVSAYCQKRGPPTNEEIKSALEKHNPQYNTQREEITNMYNELQQYSKEKIKTANQLKSMVGMALGRLNRDLAQFEKELGIEPESSVAAAGISQLGVGGSLAMVGHHGHAAAGMFRGVHPQGMLSNVSSMQQSRAAAPMSIASAATANNAFPRSSSSGSAAQPLAAAASSSIAVQQPYATSIRGTVPPPPKAVQSANLAAIHVTPSSPDWILAKIISHDKSAKMYKLSDEDVMSNQVYTIPERQVVALKGTEKNKWARGDVVYAVYPDTTSFYHATVSTPPYNGYVMVHFKDDWDVNGVTHEKAILMQHVMKVPSRGK